MNKRERSGLLVLLSAIVLILLNLPSAYAVPSYARQTGLPCSGCHTTPPELNDAGRRFKLTGYTDRADDTAVIHSEPGTKHAGLDLFKTLPLSAWFETSTTTTKSPVQGTQNGSFEFPQDVSLFLAGAWAPHVGSFAQMTYNVQKDHFSVDNTDIRITNKGTWGGKDLVYGLTLNNNPTLEDLWHGTAAWGFPFVVSPEAPTPAASPFIEGRLAQDVAGVGGYAMWNQHLYVAAIGYRSSHVGTALPTTGTGFTTNIHGVAPYGRVAWQQSLGSDTYLEVGAFGMQVKSTPGAIIGPEDKRTDTGIDVQLDQTLFIRDILSFRGTYVRETSNLAATFGAGGAAEANPRLSYFNANAEYHFGNAISAALGVTKVTGTTDAVLYAPAALSGSANGSPSSTAYIGNLSWWPSQNFQLAAQYTTYARFNGGSTDYDGSGRNAHDNDSLYLLARFVF